MKQTLLIVDDFASVRLYHVMFLSRSGYRCLQAADGAEALRQLADNHVDLLMLDMVMSGMDGRALAGELAADPRWAPLPILVVTSDEVLAAEVFRDVKNPTKIVTKPVMPQALLESVRQLLPVPTPVEAAVAEA